MKRYLALLGSGMFCVVCFSLYLMLETATSMNGNAVEMGENDLSGIEAKIKRIEADLQKNHKTINLIKETVAEIAKGNSGGIKALQEALRIDLQDSLAQGTKDVLRGIQTAIAQIPTTTLPVRAGGQQSPAIIPIYNITRVKRVKVAVPMESCAIAQQTPTKRDVQMLDAFGVIPFDNVDGGAWKQGFPLSYSTSRWNEKPLKIIVVPHSHTDPGWIKTFERYYSDQTRHIFENMVQKLEAYPKMRFMYAEMSFFSMWWNEIDHDKRQRVKRLVEENRLEIVSGGWVMPDEANSHYFAMVDQLIEGNQWLLNQLGVKPRSSWAIDPFGHSPTMAYILQSAGFEDMLIQRVHYSVKKYLAKEKALEFKWRQNWDNTGNTDILTHMMPFYSYDVPHTCGPDPKICCQFDFKRLPGGRVSCPWKIPPVPITDENVASKAETLLDQYRKKSTLYKNNVVLAIVGDDFRYDKPIEWDQQYNNYQKLFDYINSKKEWKAEVKFGTLSDYFAQIWERSGSKPGEAADYPVLSGDFFSYADREDHYWTGYFTSRPFYKRLDRVVEHHLRAAEIMYSLAVAQQRKVKGKNFPETFLMKYLVSARRSLGLFQHHDGITGTAKDFVVADYGTKLLSAIKDTKRVVQDSAFYLMLDDKTKFNQELTPYFDLDEERKTHDSLPYKTVLAVTETPRIVAFYNSLGHSRQEVVRLHVTDSNIEVTDSGGNVIPTQIDPFWDERAQISSTVFKLTFMVHVPALGLGKYSVAKKQGNKQNYISSIVLYNAGDLQGSPGPFKVEKRTTEDFTIVNSDMKIEISSATGSMKSVTVIEGTKKILVDEQFLTYGTNNIKDKKSGAYLFLPDGAAKGVTSNVTGRHFLVETQMLTYGTKISRDSKSGAYLFMPDGQAKPLEYHAPAMRVVRGPILSESTAFIPHVEHTIRIVNSPGIDGMGISITNLVDIKSENNRELVLRIKTDIQNGDTFYTDLNGFQIQKRRYLSKLPLQANYYPMPTMAYIQDDKSRLTIQTGQSLGVGGLRPGELEVMQDRRLNQDDNRGLGQGVLDNKYTPNIFRILIESREPTEKVPGSHPTGYPSLVSHLSSLELIHPIVGLPLKSSIQASTVGLHSVKPLKQDLPCELHLLNLRMLQNKEDNPDLRFQPRDETALLLHRLGVDCSFPSKALLCTPGDGKVNLKNLFSESVISSAQSTSLNLIHDTDKQLDLSESVAVPPMEIQAYKLHIT